MIKFPWPDNTQPNFPQRVGWTRYATDAVENHFKAHLKDHKIVEWVVTNLPIWGPGAANQQIRIGQDPLKFCLVEGEKKKEIDLELDDLEFELIAEPKTTEVHLQVRDSAYRMHFFCYDIETNQLEHKLLSQ